MSTQAIMFSMRSKYAFLSNFFPAPFLVRVKDETILFQYSEQYYMYMKTKSKEFRQKILQATSASQAKYYGSSKSGCPMRPNWDSGKNLREKYMLKALRYKFRQNPVLAYLLVDTGNATLVEETFWHDCFWGICVCKHHNGQGENKLGQLLMQVRKELVSGKLDVLTFNPVK